MRLKKNTVTIGVLVRPSSTPHQGGDITKPAYDSGWIKSEGDFITINHNLHTSNLFVYLMYRSDKGIWVADRDIVQGMYIDDNTAKVRTMGFSINEQVRLLLWILQD